MRRTILVPLLIFVALAAIGGAVAYWIYDSYNYYRTDDAQVTGNIVSVSAPVAGTLTSLDVKSGVQVTAGQTIGAITPVSITSTPSASGTSSSPASFDLTSPYKWHYLASCNSSRTECLSWTFNCAGDEYECTGCSSICG